MDYLYVWADGDHSDRQLPYKSDDFILFGLDTPIDDLVKWCGESAAFEIIQEVLGYD